MSSQVITRASRSDIDLSGNIRFAVNEADVPTTYVPSALVLEGLAMVERLT